LAFVTPSFVFSLFISDLRKITEKTQISLFQLLLFLMTRSHLWLIHHHQGVPWLLL